MIVDLFRDGERVDFVLSTPNHGTGNLIRNLAKLCSLPLSRGEQGLLVIRGEVPCYIDAYNRPLYIFRLGDTKVANIRPDGQVEMKAHIPAISKTLMSQTKDYRLDIGRTIVKTYIRREHKFRTDLHTHMNANLAPDVLIALGICHQIRYPLYYIKKLGLRVSDAQRAFLEAERERAAKEWGDSALQGKYLDRRIDDHTFLNFADLILHNPREAAGNIARIRSSLAIMKDGQAVFTNLEKVYLYRYVFTKGVRASTSVDVNREEALFIPDKEIREIVLQILSDRENPDYRDNTLFQDKLLWIARGYRRTGVCYAEISDTTLVKKGQAQRMLEEVHAVMPAIRKETGVLLRFLAGIRRIPLTILRDRVVTGDYFRENLEVLREIAADPYVAGSDIIGEELNDIRDLEPVIRELVRLASADPTFVIRIHAGENDSLPDNVAHSILCVKRSLLPGQAMPKMRIGHGLYTADLKQKKGKQLLAVLRENDVFLEFQITSNVRLNNLSGMKNHPLRQYLSFGIPCVQGTDGGALYGTDSIDEQLSLEKMLDMTDAEMLQMRTCEDQILAWSLEAFARKEKAWENGEMPEYPVPDEGISLMGRRRYASAEVFAERIREIPENLTPIVIAGGSFGNDRRSTGVPEDEKRFMDRLLECAEGRPVCFVIGGTLRGCEGYLAEQCRGRFPVFAMVPAMVGEREAQRILDSGVNVRVAIETAPMGTYKSIAYEIFKRRPSVLAAVDGSSAGANLVQEAKNSRYPCRIFVNRRCRMLRAKAETLEGYVTLLDFRRDDPARILED